MPRTVTSGGNLLYRGARKLRIANGLLQYLRCERIAEIADRKSRQKQENIKTEIGLTDRRRGRLRRRKFCGPFGHYSHACARDHLSGRRVCRKMGNIWKRRYVISDSGKSSSVLIIVGFNHRRIFFKTAVRSVGDDASNVKRDTASP